MKIVLLDTYKLPKTMISLIEEHVSQFGGYTSYDNTTLDNIVEHAYNADVILTNKAELTENHFKLLPNLKYVIVVATGYDCVDVKAAKQFNILVSNIPGYSTESVAQHTIALLLELTNQVGSLSYQVKDEHKWMGIKHKHVELAGLTLGIVGFGAIAKQVINIALALKMKVIVSSRRMDYITDLPIEFVNQEYLFKNSDVISLHCPCTDETREMINQKTLAMMKNSAYLINASRGGLINEADLFEALKDKRIAGASLDVLQIEPANLDNPLFLLDNCFITPHNAAVSINSFERWIRIIIENITNYKEGKLINLV